MFRRLATLRWRLTVINVALLATLLVVTGLLISVWAESVLIDAEADRVRSLAEPALYKPGAPGRPEDNLGRVAENLVRTFAGTDAVTTVRDPSGQAVGARGGAGARTGPPLANDGLPIPGKRIVHGDGNARLLVVTFGVPLGGVPASWVEIASPIARVDAALADLRAAIAVAVALAVLAGAALGLPLVGFMLRGLDRMAATARQITSGDLGRRIGGARRSDELSVVGQAFDEMLERIEAAMTERRESEERARQFAADASHELRSPLAAIGTYTDLLLGGLREDPPEAERALGAMRREIDRMTRLVDDLLSLARGDAGFEMARSPMNVAEIAASAGEHARTLARGQRICVRSAGPLIVVGDPDRLRQALFNLVDNALRHTPVGGEIEISVVADKTRAVLSVRDTGSGIDPQALPRIFDRFYRADPARSRATGNAGLGLPLVRQIAIAHGGTVRVASTPGVGSTFTLDLPAASE